MSKQSEADLDRILRMFGSVVVDSSKPFYFKRIVVTDDDVAFIDRLRTERELK